MQLAEIRKRTAPILAKHGVTHASIFGSVSRGEERPDSDIDILVTLGRPMGLIAYNNLAREIEASLNRRVDLVTEASINERVRPYILQDLKTIYEG